MPRSLPPLSALRAFEAAGRHLNMSKAAAELRVTPAAVSHQIRLLEEYCGAKLFVRHNRGLSMTPAGEICLPVLRIGFDQLAESFERLRQMTAHEVLTVNVETSFATLWLAPRLPLFRERHPDIDVWVIVRPAAGQAAHMAYDIAVAYGSRAYEGARVDHLMRERIVPVCAPEQREMVQSQFSNAIVDELPLVHDDTQSGLAGFPTWQMWLQAAKVRHNAVAHGQRVNLSHLALEEAVAGRAVALGRSRLAADHVAAGRLVEASPFSYPTEFDYYVVSTLIAADLPRVEAFRNWLLEQAKEEPPAVAAQLVAASA